jgi:hypothetical protein
MTASYDTDPNTQTIADAWASSELGQPEHEVRYGFATSGPTESVTASEEEPTARRVMVAAGLAYGVAAGALIGVMLFTYTDSSQPTVVAPGPAPQHAVVVGPRTAAPTPKPVCPSRVQLRPLSFLRLVSSRPRPMSPHLPLRRRARPPLSSTSRFRTTRRCLKSQGKQDPEGPDPEPPKPPVLDDPNFKQPESAGAPGFAARQVPGAAAAGPTAAEAETADVRPRPTRDHRTVLGRAARVSAGAQHRRLPGTGRDPRRLGWTLQCPYAQTHLATHRVVRHL